MSGTFPLPVSLSKPLLVRQFTCGFHVTFAVRTPLHYLRPAIHTEVVSVFPQHPSQAVNGYYQISFHVVSFRLNLLGSPM
jgi:hypothetical protein